MESQRCGVGEIKGRSFNSVKFYKQRGCPPGTTPTRRLHGVREEPDREGWREDRVGSGAMRWKAREERGSGKLPSQPPGALAVPGSHVGPLLHLAWLWAQVLCGWLGDFGQSLVGCKDQSG